ncbi:hypothetical protein BCV70DRAFT_220309 [Testicularia cyperi]|uniref:Uncharacterized protein n=1 Tax=Testicularia cyperi TaxID=1882483 RepID=A0A317XZ01_9BASI|nr:hypothetical protein BCV70DRAFT_220309 [Testicularia cyperi]
MAGPPRSDWRKQAEAKIKRTSLGARTAATVRYSISITHRSLAHGGSAADLFGLSPKSKSGLPTQPRYSTATVLDRSSTPDQSAAPGCCMLLAEPFFRIPFSSDTVHRKVVADTSSGLSLSSPPHTGPALSLSLLATFVQAITKSATLHLVRSHHKLEIVRRLDPNDSSLCPP